MCEFGWFSKGKISIIVLDRPYNIYGGLQDNGSAKGPSTKKNGGTITLEDWFRVGGGDGMYNVVDPTNSRWLYNESQFGPLTRIDQVTGESKSIAYQNQNREMRWNWNAPILISPHDASLATSRIKSAKFAFNNAGSK